MLASQTTTAINGCALPRESETLSNDDGKSFIYMEEIMLKKVQCDDCKSLYLTNNCCPCQDGKIRCFDCYEAWCQDEQNKLVEEFNNE